MSAAGRARAALGAAVLACAAFALAAAPARAVTLERAPGEGPARVRWLGARDSAVHAAADTSAAARAAWQARLALPGAAPTALRVLADLRAAAGDTSGADSCLRALAAGGSVWQWDALQRLAARAQAARGPAAADSLLAPVDRVRWSDAERAAWLDHRARLRLAAGDSTGAGELARQLVLAYPGTGAPAAHGIALLDSLAAARGDSLAMDVLRMGAEIDVFRGARPSAIARLKRVLARTAPGERFGPALKLAETLRGSRMPLAARTAADAALVLASSVDDRARAQLERARALRDAAKTDSALALDQRVAHSTASPALRTSAWWEYARECEDRGRYRDALEGFTRLAQLGEQRADDARFQAGLMLFALGEPDSARAWWRRGSGENARFWLAIALRGRDRAASDSLLHALAVLPGYGYYRAAARETLGVRGWPAEGRDVAVPAADAVPALASDLHALVDAGRGADAGELLARFAAGDVRAGAGRSGAGREALALAALAFETGRPALGTRLAERAFAAAPDDSSAWAIVPWAYPPAWAEAIARASTPEVEPALLWALSRQESRFDPQARSRSDALGLTQLKLATAGDVARALGEAKPAERDLFVPDRALRYGARYLGQLVKRFDGRVPVALAAYNAGPSAVRADWRELVARGGEALYCELASNADSQDYVKRITGFVQAYRELRPLD